MLATPSQISAYKLVLSTRSKLPLERHPVRRHGGPERRNLPRLRAVEENAQNWCLKMTETIVPSSLGLLTRTAAPPCGRPWLRDVRECSCLLRRHQQAKHPKR